MTEVINQDNVNSEVAAGQESVAEQATESNEFSFDTFLGQLDDQTRETFTKNGVKDLDTLGKSYKGLLEMKGKKGLINPGENASDEERSAYRESLLNELGRPENAEYEFDLPESVSDDMVDDTFLDGLAETAYANGMNKTGFQELITKIYTAYGQEMEKINAWKAEVEAKIGEGSLNDNSEAESNSKVSLEQRAQAKLVEAREAKKNNDFKLAAKLQAESQEIRAKIL